MKWTHNAIHSVLCFGFSALVFWGLASPKHTIVERQPASINRAVLVLVKPSIYFGIQGEAISPELIDSYNQVKLREKPFDVGQVIPSGLLPTGDSNIVFSKIADQSVSSFFNSSSVRGTPFGKSATSVEQKMKQDVTLGSGESQHKFTFRVQAFQASAKIEYKGFTNAALKYQARDSSVGLEVSERITKNKELVLEQLNKPEDRISSMNVRWAF